MKKVLAVVPARSGSKGFPNKNIAKIKGVTLLELAVQVAIDCPEIDDVLVSTDSLEYESLALDRGAKSLGLRNSKLSNDSAKTADVVIDLLKKSSQEYDYVVLLQPTSPIRKPSDVSNMLSLIFGNPGIDSVVSVCKVDEPHPYKMKTFDSNGYLKPFIENTNSEVPRQSLPEVYALNGAIYVVRTSVFLNEKRFLTGNTLPYEMNGNFNVDNEDDFLFIKMMEELGKICLWGVSD